MRGVQVEPNAIWWKREDLVFALELCGRLMSRAQCLLICAASALLFVPELLHIDVFNCHGHRSVEDNVFFGSSVVISPHCGQSGVISGTAGASSNRGASVASTKVNHELTRPPIARAFNNRLDELLDGTVVIRCDVEVLDEARIADLTGMSISFHRQSDAPSADILVSFNPKYVERARLERLVAGDHMAERVPSLSAGQPKTTSCSLRHLETPPPQASSTYATGTSRSPTQQLGHSSSALWSEMILPFGGCVSIQSKGPLQRQTC